MKGQGHLYLIGTYALLVQKTLKGWKSSGPYKARSVSRTGRTSSEDHKRDHSQSPNADRTSSFELLLARFVDWVLAGSSLVGELLILLTKLELGWLLL